MSKFNVGDKVIAIALDKTHTQHGSNPAMQEYINNKTVLTVLYVYKFQVGASDKKPLRFFWHEDDLQLLSETKPTKGLAYQVFLQDQMLQEASGRPLALDSRGIKAKKGGKYE